MRHVGLLQSSRLAHLGLALLSAAFLLSALFAPGAAAQEIGDSASQDVQADDGHSADLNGVLRFGIEGEYAPFAFVDDQGELAGFDIDLANEIARRLGVKAQFIPHRFPELIERLENGEFDAIIAAMSATEERSALVDFTDPYISSGTVLIVREDDDRFAGLDDIAGHRVAVAEGTTFEALARTVEDAEIIVLEKVDSYITALLTGEADVVIEDELVALYVIRELGLPLKIASPAFNAERLAIAVRKGDHELLETLNRVLAEIKADGTLDAIYVKWFAAAPRP